MDLSWVPLLCGLVTFASGQWQGGPLETGIGYFEGREIRTDDLFDQRLGGRISQNILPPFPTMGPFGANAQRRVLVSPGLGGPLGQGHFSPNRLRSCQANVCTLEFIPVTCRYTPVLQSAFGEYCLGCPEDICETRRRLTPRQRRRRRRIKRRLCRNFGICLGGQSRRQGRQSGRRGGQLGRQRDILIP